MLTIVRQSLDKKVVQAHYYVRPLIVIIISKADLNVVGKNVSSNVSDHEGPSSVNNIILFTDEGPSWSETFELTFFPTTFKSALLIIITINL